MAEKKGVGHAYNIDFLNVVFAASSVFLFLSVVWMVWDDFDRDWKNTQRRFNRLEMQVTQTQLQSANRRIDQNKVKQLETQRAEAERNVKANQKKVDELQDKLQEIENRLYRVTQDYQFTKATYDHDKYEFEVARDAKQRGWEKKGQAVQALEAKLNDLNLKVEQVTA